MNLYLTSKVNTTATVSIPGLGISNTYTILANSVTVAPVSQSAYVPYTKFETVQDRGIQVTSEHPIVVYSHIYSGSRSAATLVLPTNTLGREYFAASYTKNTNPNTTNFSEFMVVATEDNTTVEIVPKADTRGGAKAGQPYNINLNKGQIYQVHSAFDLTGSKIISISNGGNSCKKIAVFSGHTFVAIGNPITGCNPTGDNLYQQLYPLSAWGSNFATAPLKNRSEGDIFRIIAGSQNTKVIVNGGAPQTLNAGEYFDFHSISANFITADNPITVLQYATTQNCKNGDLGDPEMIILNPVEQVLEDITLYSSNQFDIKANYINVVIKTEFASTFRLDGSPVTFSPIQANPLYSYAQVSVNAGNHRLIGQGGFNAMAYGFGQVESYGYSAGANIKNLNHNITFDAQNYCEGDKVTFTGFASYEPQSWFWEFGDGNTSTEQNPKYTYAAPGTYTVKLTTVKNNGNDCDSKDETIAELIVYPNPKADFNYVPECLNEAMFFKDVSSIEGNNSQITDWFWDFGDGKTSTEQHPKHIYTAPGIYNVKLKVNTTAGCVNEISKEVEMLRKPVLVFDAPSVCNTFETHFTDKSNSALPISGWLWDFGDGNTSTEQNPKHIYDKSGTFNVKLTLKFEEGCQTSVTQQVIVHPKPVIKVELPGVCINDEASFVNKTTIALGTVSYLWDFGDGSTSTLVSPKHKYKSEGVYKVKLTATSDKWCVETIELDYVVSGANPQAGFSSTGSCQRDGIQFKDESTIAFGNIIRWEWDFGDGNSSTEQNPLHIYKDPGTYDVTLKAFSGIVCYGVIRKTITVTISPAANFETANVCFGESAGFKSTSFVELGKIVAHRWDFGDGKFSDDINPTHSYGSAGTYEVTLLVTTDIGCQHSYKQKIVIYEKPQAAFSPVVGCLSEPVYFKNESTVANGGKIVSWTWNFGDGASSVDQHPSHKYSLAGKFNVSLKVVTEDGCSSEIIKIIDIKPVPIANAGPDQKPVCGITNTNLEANILSHGTGFWSITKGVGGQLSDPTNPKTPFTGKMEETYTLKWTVSNSPCDNASDEVEIKFSAYPKVYAGPNQEIIEGESIVLAGSGTGTLVWSPASTLDNANIAKPTASPVENTTYTLTATSPDGCESTSQVNVRVLQRLQIPNGISPNGDGINDLWIIKGVEDYPDISIDIYNRWGDKVYSNKGYSKPWDATRNGSPLPDGAYYYIIDTHKGRKPFTGSLTVLRR